MRHLFILAVELQARPEWRALEERRAIDFHRWRDETPLVIGTERKSLWRHDPIERTRTLHLIANTTPEPAVAASAVSDITAVTQTAINLLEPLMRQFRTTWMSAMSDLSGGTFSWVEDGPSITPTITR